LKSFVEGDPPPQRGGRPWENPHKMEGEDKTRMFINHVVVEFVQLGRPYAG